MAIDREAIVNAIFLAPGCPRTPSPRPPSSATAPEPAAGGVNTTPDESKALLAEAGFDTDAPVEIWFNAGAGHDGWMTAVGNMFRKIGLTYKLRGNLQFNEFLSKRDASWR